MMAEFVVYQVVHAVEQVILLSTAWNNNSKFTGLTSVHGMLAQTTTLRSTESLILTSITHSEINTKLLIVSSGWRSGKSTRLPPMWLRFDSWTQRHMWVEFVVGSRPCSEMFFSGYSGFPLSSKTNTSKFQFDLESVPYLRSALNTLTLE